MEAPAMQCFRQALSYAPNNRATKRTLSASSGLSRRRLLAADHKVNIVLRPEAMRHGRKKAIRIRRQIHARDFRLQRQHAADERRVLVGEAVMVLPRPGARLEVIERANRLPPVRLLRHLHELAVLYHHSVYDS